MLAKYCHSRLCAAHAARLVAVETDGVRVRPQHGDDFVGMLFEDDALRDWPRRYAGGGHDEPACKRRRLATSSAAATGHEEEAQAAATGHEEAQATATGQEKKSAATGDNEQALAEAPSSATGQRRRDDKPLLDAPEIDDETGPIWDNGHRPREEVCSHRR